MEGGCSTSQESFRQCVLALQHPKHTLTCFGVQDSALHSLAAARQAVLADLAVNPPVPPAGAQLGAPTSPARPGPPQGAAWAGNAPGGAWRSPPSGRGGGDGAGAWGGGGVPLQEAQGSSPARLPGIREAAPAAAPDPLAQARAMVSPAISLRTD